MNPAEWLSLSGSMRRLTCLVLSAGLMAAQAFVALSAASAAADPSGYHPALERYVRFLERQKRPPVEYILSLFEKYDIVVFCERAHPEVTQYDLLYELASHPRFQEEVGHIFTEVGSSASRPLVDSLLVDDSLTKEQVDEKLCCLARNFDFGSVWDKTNIYDFLRRLQGLNRSLPEDRRVRVYPSGIHFRWENATRESLNAFNRQLNQRDRLMAENIIQKFNELGRADRRKKALVIMNFRHAFPHLKPELGGPVENTGGVLMEAYPDRLANVMLNFVRILPGSTDSQVAITAVHEGKWDAAFGVLGNPSLGFDFKESPLGTDEFDYFPFIPLRLRYQDVFTGFVFYQPLARHRMSFGLPGLIDASFGDELARRHRLHGRDDSRAQIDREVARLGTLRLSGYEDATVFSRSDCAAKIQQWLTPKP